METLKRQIIDLLWANATESYGKGSCGELGDSSQVLDSDSFSDVANEIIKIIEGDNSDFDKAVEPAIRYLLKNHNPHTKIHIDYSTAELLQGQKCHNLNKEIPD